VHLVDQARPQKSSWICLLVVYTGLQNDVHANTQIQLENMRRVKSANLLLCASVDIIDESA